MFAQVAIALLGSSANAQSLPYSVPTYFVDPKPPKIEFFKYGPQQAPPCRIRSHKSSQSVLSAHGLTFRRVNVVVGCPHRNATMVTPEAWILWDSREAWVRYTYAKCASEKVEYEYLNAANILGGSARDAWVRWRERFFKESKGYRLLPAGSRVVLNHTYSVAFSHFGDCTQGSDTRIVSFTVLSGPLKGRIGWIAPK